MRPVRPATAASAVSELPRLAAASAAAIAALTVGFLLGVPVAPAALAAGLVLLAFRPALWTARLHPALIVGVLALFGGAALLQHSLDVTGRLADVTPLGLAAGAAMLSNVGSNLTAVVLLEPAAGSEVLAKALLIGANLGVGLTPIGSLATILWRDAIRSHACQVPWRPYFALAVPLSALFVALTPVLARADPGGARRRGRACSAPAPPGGSRGRSASSIPARSKASFSAGRRARSSFQCWPGAVLITSRMTAPSGPRSSTPSTSGSASTSSFHGARATMSRRRGLDHLLGMGEVGVGRHPEVEHGLGPLLRAVAHPHDRTVGHVPHGAVDAPQRPCGAA